jgi:hypothetical protein
MRVRLGASTLAFVLGLVSLTLDPDGRRVALRDRRWAHIKLKHPILATRLGQIMSTAREPYLQMTSEAPNEVWFFSEDAGRYPWLQVLVHYEGVTDG